MNMILDLNRYFSARSPLPRAARAIARGHITIGFVGGSITEPGDERRWSDKVVDWLVARFPGLTVDVENAAKGATGTLSAVFRMEEDILCYNCDLVLVETAVNDPSACWGPGREGLLRKLLRGPGDLLITYTYQQSWYDDLINDRLPDSIADWEKLAEHYRISSVNMGKYAFDLVMRGNMRWEEWLPDGLHPEHAGSRLYAEPVCALLEAELTHPGDYTCSIPAPLFADHWESTYSLPFDAIRRVGAWRQIHERRVPSVTHVLTTSSMTSSLRFSFTGRGLVFHVMMNIRHSAYRVRIDGGEWIERADPVPEWAIHATEWVREDPPIWVPSGPHTVEIQPFFAPNALGSLFELCRVGIIE